MPTFRESLLTVSLLGTENQALPVCDSAGELAEWLRSLQSESEKLGRERTVLHAASLVYAYGRAGAILDKFANELPLPAPVDDMPVMSVAAAKHFTHFLQFDYALLTEWFELVVAYGKRIRDEQLAQALKVGAEDHHLREFVKKVVGKRGLWLSSFNPDWRYVLTEQSELDWDKLSADWSTGSLEEREVLLTLARKHDAKNALWLLASTWQEEGMEARVKFLACLDQGLSMADEPFLEELALNDKRKEVRSGAQRLLTMIPQSRYQERARARAFAALKIVEIAPKAILGPLIKAKKALEIEVPGEVDKDLVRDGIVAKSNDKQMGDKAFVLKQVICAIDPFEYCSKYDIEYNELLDLVEKSDWKTAVMGGLEDGSIIFDNSACAKAHLLRGNCTDFEGLAKSLSAADKEEVLSKLFESNGMLPPASSRVSEWTALYMVLREMGRFTPAFSKVVLNVLKNHLRQSRGDFYSIDDLVKASASRVDLSLIGEFQSAFASFGSIPLVDRALETMHFRQRMKTALMSEK